MSKKIVRKWIKKREWIKKKMPATRAISIVARLLDKVAEREVIARRHVAQRLELLAEVGLELEDITPEVIAEAENFHRREVKRIVTKLGATYA